MSAPDGRCRRMEFRKAGTLTAGDNPELYFFDVDGEEVVVGVSGEALQQFQDERRYLTREEKVDLTALFLKRHIEAGTPLISEFLFIRGSELAGLWRDLGLAA